MIDRATVHQINLQQLWEEVQADSALWDKINDEVMEDVGEYIGAPHSEDQYSQFELEEMAAGAAYQVIVKARGGIPRDSAEWDQAYNSERETPINTAFYERYGSPKSSGGSWTTIFGEPLLAALRQSLEEAHEAEEE